MFTNRAAGTTSAAHRIRSVKAIKATWAATIAAAAAITASLIGPASAPASAQTTTPATQAAIAAGQHLAAQKGHATSPVWSGYVDTGNQFRSVSAEFIAPNVNCANSPIGTAGYAQVMAGVGLGGWTSTGINSEQVGFAAGCSGTGQFQPYVWYLTGHSSLVNMGVGTVQSGDAIRVKVSYNPSAAVYTLTLTDLTRPSVSFSQTINRSQCAGQCDNSSAEVITQALFGPGNGFNLADFGELSFTNARVKSLGGHTGTLAGNSHWKATDATLADPFTGDTLVCRAGNLCYIPCQ